MSIPRIILGPGFALLLALFNGGGVRGAESASAGPRPNIVLIVADDLGWSDLGCYGADLHETPAGSQRWLANGIWAMPAILPKRTGST